MQDLEELKKVLKDISWSDLVDVSRCLIARCESAEKDRDDARELLSLHRAGKEVAWCKVTGKAFTIKEYVEIVRRVNFEKESLENELKWLRAQEPAAWVCEYANNPWPNGGGRRFETKELADAYLKTPLGCSYNKVSPIYLDPIVELSRDSAAPSYPHFKRLMDEAFNVYWSNISNPKPDQDGEVQS